MRRKKIVTKTLLNQLIKKYALERIIIKKNRQEKISRAPIPELKFKCVQKRILYDTAGTLKVLTFHLF